MEELPSTRSHISRVRILDMQELCKWKRLVANIWSAVENEKVPRMDDEILPTNTSRGTGPPPLLRPPREISYYEVILPGQGFSYKPAFVRNRR